MTDHKALLFNASNMESSPVYPYAFIQIPAVARRVGIEVSCQELLGVPEDSWGEVIQAWIGNHKPEMILITLRNTDSMDKIDYEISQKENKRYQPYFPIESTKALIAKIREISNLKVALGGFGFSVIPEDLMHYLRPDIGVFGDPDGFFQSFQSILDGNLQSIPNLLYFHNDRLISNPRRFYPPFSGAEYTSQAIEAMMAFYKAFPDPGFFGAPIEIIRGCPHGCIFCSEPHVKGKQVRYRDLAAVMEDVEILVEHGITRLYMISSELNPEGNKYALELADQLQFFNKQQPLERKITWFGANYLLQFNLVEFKKLHKSGFIGGWFDVTALDDENARAMQTPYRNRSLLTYLRNYARHESSKMPLPQAQAETTPGSSEKQESPQLKDPAVEWTMFLGNPETTVETIRNTLRIASQEGLAGLFSRCGINTVLRVFDYENPNRSLLEKTYSINPRLERTSYQQILPSFAYPPALLEKFGTELEISRILKYIKETYLSTRYQKSRDWLKFLRENTSYEQAAGWLTVSSYMASFTNLQALFDDDAQDEGGDPLKRLAGEVVDWLMKSCLGDFPELLRSLDLPDSMDSLDGLTPYGLAAAVYQRWTKWEDLEKDLADLLERNHQRQESSFFLFCMKSMLYRFNIILEPKLKGLFVENTEDES